MSSFWLKLWKRMSCISKSLFKIIMFKFVNIFWQIKKVMFKFVKKGYDVGTNLVGRLCCGKPLERDEWNGHRDRQQKQKYKIEKMCSW